MSSTLHVLLGLVFTSIGEDSADVDIARNTVTNVRVAGMAPPPPHVLPFIRQSVLDVASYSDLSLAFLD